MKDKKLPRKLPEVVRLEINAMCFYLVELAQKHNATKFTIENLDIKKRGRLVGNWRVIVEKY